MRRLERQKKITPPAWLIDQVHFACITGSEAYGCNTDNSDRDIYGWCIPRIEYIFPHTQGYLVHYDNLPKFNEFEMHGVEDTDSGVNYDFKIYNLVHYVKVLCKQNPNMLDSLFSPPRCILHSTQCAQILIDNKTEFLSKQCVKPFFGYAFAQKTRVDSRLPDGEARLRKYEGKINIQESKYTLKDIESEIAERGLVLDN